MAVSILAGWLLAAGARAGDDKPAWTILIYGHGDHNLAPQLVEDIRKLAEAGSGPGFNIVIETDFDASQRDDLAEAGLPEELAGGTTRLRLKAPAGRKNPLAADVVQRLPEFNHDDPKVLADFLKWALRQYPAKRYGLIFWDHGGQWEGYGGDSQDGTLEDTGVLTTAQIAAALRAAGQDAGIGKWDFIAFDTCLMGGAEVLADFAAFTDFFIACPEIDFGDGWDYTASLRWLKANPEAGMTDFARREAEAWKNEHLQDEKTSDLILAAHAAYDLRQYPAFERAFRDFAGALQKAAAPDNLEIPLQRRKSTEYSVGEIQSLGQPTEYVDLGEFAQRLSQDQKLDPRLRELSAGLVKAIDAMVLTKVCGAAKAKAHGLSIWYPVNGRGQAEAALDAEEEDDDDDDDSAPARGGDDGDGDGESAEDLEKKFAAYQQTAFARATPWGAYLDRVHANAQGKVTAPPELKSALAADAKVLPASAAAPAQLPVEIARGAAAFSVNATLVANNLTKDRADHVYLGEIAAIPAGGPGRYTVKWDSRLPCFLDAGGKPLAPLGGAYLTADSSLLVSYARYQRPHRRRAQDVILITQIADGRGKIVEVLDASDEEYAPTALEVEPGGTLKPVFYMQKRKGADPEKWADREFVAKQAIAIPEKGVGAIPIACRPVHPGDYLAELTAEDIYGNTSAPVSFAIRVAP
jgi:hypothetical protein